MMVKKHKVASYGMHEFMHANVLIKALFIFCMHACSVPDKPVLFLFYTNPSVVLFSPSEVGTNQSHVGN